MKILEVTNLTKYYGKDKALVKAVDNVSFYVNKGDFIAIVGPSGGGKSTLMHLLGGLDKPDKGKVIINGVDIYNLKGDKLTVFRRQNIGFIYQFYNLIPVLTVRENIMLPAVLDSKTLDIDYFNDFGHEYEMCANNYLPYGRYQKIISYFTKNSW